MPYRGVSPSQRLGYDRLVDGRQLVVVTGLSGAGRSTALRVLEDLGFYCVDNLPPRLAPELVRMLEAQGELQRVGLGIDVRAGAFLQGVTSVLDELSEQGLPVSVLFLDASDAALVRRFSETRRPHRLAPDGNVEEAIRSERQRLSDLRTRADRVIDTTALTVHDLRRQLVQLVGGAEGGTELITRVVSFGFKYGLPQDADLVFDLRYLPNPHFVPELQPKTGLSRDVSDYVLGSGPGAELLDELRALLVKLLPRYEAEGKAYLTVAVGCTGGQHRSVAMAEALGKSLSHGTVVVAHRDVSRASKS